MRPNLHPSLVNGRFGDPALYVERLHQRGALLFDLGDIAALSARDLLRIDHVFVTHTHMDHFIGFDSLLRVHVGREKRIAMTGPKGFRERVHHKLQAYEWDLVDRYDTDLVFDVQELDADTLSSARFRFKTAFRWEGGAPCSVADGRVASAPGFEVHAAVLDHHGPCLGFAMREPAHVNVWKNRLEERGLPTGPWLQPLKQAVIDEAPDDHRIALPDGATAPLADLRDLITVSRGQKIAYVTDVADTPGNRSKITRPRAGAQHLVHRIPFGSGRCGAGGRASAPHHPHRRGNRPRGRRQEDRAVPLFTALRRRGGADGRRGDCCFRRSLRVARPDQATLRCSPLSQTRPFSSVSASRLAIALMKRLSLRAARSNSSMRSSNASIVDARDLRAWKRI